MQPLIIIMKEAIKIIHKKKFYFKQPHVYTLKYFNYQKYLYTVLKHLETSKVIHCNQICITINAY